MAFLKGNEYYKIRLKDGREPIFKKPKQLLDKINEYFEWAHENPLIEIDYRGKDATKRELPRMRPLTIGGCCIYLGIVRSTWKEYGKKPGFSTIITRAEETMREQKFAGAAAGFLNPNIIARDLGLADKREIDDKRPMTDEEREERIARLMSKMNEKKD